MPIDRSFIVQGHGTIVTGSVLAGSVRVGDEVEWLPSGQTVRVRSLQNHDQPVEEVHRGMRAAINLAGVDHKDVVRGPSATLTIGGGQVLQPVAKKIRRRHLEILERIEKLWTGDPKQRALLVAWFGGYGGFTQTDLVRDANVGPDQALQLIQQLRDEKQLVTVPLQAGRQIILHVDVISELDERILSTLGKMHEEFPLMTSHDRQKVQAQLDYVGDDPLIHAEVDRLIRMKKLTGDLRRIARADFKPKLSANLRKLKDKVVAAYLEASFQPPTPASFASQAGGNAANLNDLFEVCVAEGFLVHVDGDVYLHADIDAEMRKRVAERLARGPGATVAELRDLLGTTRKYAVPFCEYLDRIGVTHREGDLRVAGTPTV
jgi:selenocysteine-specific elongation factor